MTAHAVLTMTGTGRPGLTGGVLRAATDGDAPAIHALIDRYQAAGRLLPRSVEEIARHADRFLVVGVGAEVLGCAELAPLSGTVAEVRSLVVDESARGLGFGRLLVGAIADEAHLAGFRTICAFTHEPGYFVRLGYSLVPHAWLPQKIALDCAGCALFRACGQDAVRLHLGERPQEARA